MHRPSPTHAHSSTSARTTTCQPCDACWWSCRPSCWLLRRQRAWYVCTSAPPTCLVLQQARAWRATPVADHDPLTIHPPVHASRAGAPVRQPASRRRGRGHGPRRRGPRHRCGHGAGPGAREPSSRPCVLHAAPEACAQWQLQRAAPATGGTAGRRGTRGELASCCPTRHVHAYACDRGRDTNCHAFANHINDDSCCVCCKHPRRILAVGLSLCIHGRMHSSIDRRRSRQRPPRSRTPRPVRRRVRTARQSPSRSFSRP